MSDAKRPWVCPALLVIVKNHTEEAVLAGCKRWPVEIYGPQTTEARCGLSSTGSGCPACSAWTAS